MSLVWTKCCRTKGLFWSVLHTSKKLHFLPESEPRAGTTQKRTGSSILEKGSILLWGCCFKLHLCSASIRRTGQRWRCWWTRLCWTPCVSCPTPSGTTSPSTLSTTPGTTSSSAPSPSSPSPASSSSSSHKWNGTKFSPGQNVNWACFDCENFVRADIFYIFKLR